MKKSIFALTLSLLFTNFAQAAHVSCILNVTGEGQQKTTVQVNENAADGASNLLKVGKYEASVMTAFGKVQTLLLVDRDTKTGYQSTTDEGTSGNTLTILDYSGSVPTVKATLMCF